jgi:hypothetical protein
LWKNRRKFQEWKKEEKKSMFWADFGSRRNGRFGEAVRGLSAFFGRGSFIAVLRGHRAEANKGASDCRGEE